ncbi:MAG: bifunctional [glutamine synthetase] adenylyltransferase/[glutamine synthetase]-adenylyl-L-tyrosine phosphorylase [Alphaproteobacteria bacterium]|nr:bifunctional [glutamine synthetase] adenylyltransferase/[glutamine synthetase]-adenylyl-L-tyrosine phosphorylase [Alphaproteobacteria bacterium]
MPASASSALPFLPPAERWPKPADPAAAERGIAAFAETGAAARRFAARADVQPMLRALFGNSPFLSDAALKEPELLSALFATGPDAAFAGLLAELAAAPAPATTALAPSAHALSASLRRTKRRGALIAALADIGGVWPLEGVTGALSALADATLQRAAEHVLREAHAAGTLRLRDPARPAEGSGWIILGMGKLGAQALNFSSDIDLILFYDLSARVYTGENPTALFVRMTRELVRLMEERTGEGYVFRTDLRLRPDPGATPACMSVDAAHAYYESMGQNWERAAMIKARPVAGDLAAGAAFLDELRPYVWRKHLDFAAIQDIHSIKRQIAAHRGGDAIAVGGHNVKLGRGGIREIEFFAQTLQLIWGGRNPKLRVPSTLPALHALAGAGLVPGAIVRDLEAAYRFLRGVEHRLQMIDDRQTHQIPAEPARLSAFATFMGFASADAFAERLLFHLCRVEAAYAGLFEEAKELSGPGSLVFTGTADDPETIATLSGLGFGNAAGIAQVVRGWHHGRYRATRSQRARELLTELMPALLAALGRQRDPDAAFGRFDAFLSRLPAGVQLFSLLQHNTGLLDRLAGIFGAAPMLADHLAANPAVLDGLLAPNLPDLSRRAISADLGQALHQTRHFEEALDAMRRFTRERNFQIGVATLEGRIDVDDAGAARSALAEAALAELLPRTLADFALRQGRVKGGGLAVVAMGKLGGREMMAASDLDLILIYDHPPEVEATTPPRAQGQAAGTAAGKAAGATAAGAGAARGLSVSQYYTRLAQRFTAAITSPTAEGKLYEVDMRLRPSGSKGPIATSLSGFARYHETEAWIWEHMALTRARAIAGTPALRRTVGAAIHAILTRQREPGAVRAAVAEMRARMERDLPASGPWDVKLRPGGLVDIEFIAQGLQLIHAAERPELLDTNTAAALGRLARAGLIAPAEAQALIEAARLWRTVQGALRLTVGKLGAEEVPPDPVAHALLRGSGAVDVPALLAQMEAVAARTRAIFTSIFPPVPEAPSGAAGATSP